VGKEPPQIAVVIPLTDARGDAVEHIRTWTETQTLPRDRFQVVIASDGEERQVDHAVEELLEPHDTFQVIPGAGLLRLYNAAATSASAPWLLVTENHCQGEPDCLEQAVKGIQASPELEAARIEHGHVTPGVTGELGARWFDDVYAEWSGPGGWTRLNLAGFLIRRDVFESAGALDERFGLFAPPLVAAKLHERGARVGEVSGARILHVHVDGIEEHHGHSANYARGELEARTSLDPEFAERYFGHHHLLWNREGLRRPVAKRKVAILARELRRAALTDRRDVSWLLRELRSTLPDAAAGMRARRWSARTRFSWDELAARLPWSRRRRYRHYLRAQDGVVRVTQLEWIAAQSRGGSPALSPGTHPIAEIPAGVAFNVHGLEEREGRVFRWSEPVLTLRLDASARGGELRIDTGGLRASPRTCVIGAYLGEKRLRPSGLSEKGGILALPIPDLPGDLTLVVRPLDPPASGTQEKRRLGLPIFFLELVAAPSATPSSGARERAAVGR